MSILIKSSLFLMGNRLYLLDELMFLMAMNQGSRSRMSLLLYPFYGSFS
jgi:hypothetical protein